jgi:hypothetical protein
MVASQHFQRLKHIYTSSSNTAADQIAISYGRAELEGTLTSVSSGAILNHQAHDQLLRDAAALAAGSVEKEHVVTTEQFSVDMARSDYEGPVLASAEVELVEGPRYMVRGVLVDDHGELVAEAQGVFRAGEDTLPPDPAPDAADAETGTSPPPASFMPIHTTPFGMLCLN